MQILWGRKWQFISLLVLSPNFKFKCMYALQNPSDFGLLYELALLLQVIISKHCPCHLIWPQPIDHKMPNVLMILRLSRLLLWVQM
jgi:hypothetical protein